MKFTISKCQCCRTCATLYPEYFAICDDTAAYIKEQPTPEIVEKINCPHIVEYEEDK